MAAALEFGQAGAGDGLPHPDGDLVGQEVALTAPGDEGGALDAGPLGPEVGPLVGINEPAVALPDALSAGGFPRHVPGLVGQRLVGGVGLAGAQPLDHGVQRVPLVGLRLVALEHGGRLRVGGVGVDVDDDQGSHRLRVAHSVEERVASAGRVSHEHEVSQGEGLDHRLHVLDVVVEAVPVGPLAVAVAPVVQGHDVIVLAHGGGEDVPAPGAVLESVQKHHRRGRGVAPPEVVESELPYL